MCWIGVKEKDYIRVKKVAREKIKSLKVGSVNRTVFKGVKGTEIVIYGPLNTREQILDKIYA